MCDYSLEYIASRPAAVGDELISTRFGESITRGFRAAGDPNVAVCLLPGTELAFERDVEFDNIFGMGREVVAARVARFREVDVHEPRVHHDALEFPDGKVVLVTRLVEGQHVTVLQLPAPAQSAKAAEQPQVTEKELLGVTR